MNKPKLLTLDPVQESSDREIDDLLFIEEDINLSSSPTPQKTQNLLGESWKVLIVDDEVEVHKVTKLALSDFTLEGKPISFVSAYSGQEAKQQIKLHSDTAIIFLDVVMETDRAGLDVVKFIREELGNQLVRIVLRTGQPGQAPESIVILNYDINDYKTKTELTAQKLFTTTVTALRSFCTFAKMLETSESLQKEIINREAVEIALRKSEAKEKQKSQHLEKALKDLQQTQFQLIQAEKMSSLGQMVAGIAHEINNPISFIYGNVKYSDQYVKDLLEIIKIYEQNNASVISEIQQKAEEIDLEFIKKDLPQMIGSMRVGLERITEIIKSMRSFSRVDEAELKAVNIHDGIENTLTILHHRLKASTQRSAIQVIKQYEQIPLVDCYPNQLNQVFMNILANAIEAIEEKLEGSVEKIQGCIKITTELVDNKKVLIRISDNGSGIKSEAMQHLFEPFFTTKPVGKGTGMGMMISHQIIVEKHKGTLKCSSTINEGTEFIIEIPLRNVT